jgi:hypothetical protein
MLHHKNMITTKAGMNVHSISPGPLVILTITEIIIII